MLNIIWYNILFQSMQTDYKNVLQYFRTLIPERDWKTVFWKFTRKAKSYIYCKRSTNEILAVTQKSRFGYLIPCSCKVNIKKNVKINPDYFTSSSS